MHKWLPMQSGRRGDQDEDLAMRMAYADPPYIGQAQKHYQCPEIDHAQLINDLMHYEGWALSLSSPSLKQILNLCPEDVRIGAWVKPFCSFKPNVNPAYAWEPVIFWGGRKIGRENPTIRDFVSANITLNRGTHGAKPKEFCYWIFNILGMQPQDEFYDLFYGSGAVTKAWKSWCMQSQLFMEE
jgi:hypothetical protein